MKLLSLIDAIPYPALILATIFLGLAPFHPVPHLIEKIQMLRMGQLTRPIDIFDLFYHALPALLLIIKVIKDFLK